MKSLFDLKRGLFTMTPDYLKSLLDDVRDGNTAVDAALEQLRQLPFQDLGFAQVDHHRQLRQGMPEVIFGEGKTIAQIERIMTAMSTKGSNVLVTRLDAGKAQKILTLFPA
ncbi:MAG: hypothetical protein WCL71_16345, partial [Deltaproteobacteria bacterium]